MKKFKVGILGATGAVGQRFIQLLENHPWFTITALCASENSAGRTYAEAATWRLPTTMPAAVRAMILLPCEPQAVSNVDFLFSALPADNAREVEPAFAAAGYPVISNASYYRMVEDVPLLIPEVNPEHTALIDIQRQKRGWKGYIVTNPNCATVGLVPPLKALAHFGLDRVLVTTMQATSGAGYPGPPLEVIGDNVLPYIGGEDEKIESEPAKLLGTFVNGGIQAAKIVVSAQANRVHVSDGHLESISFSLRDQPSLEEVIQTLKNYRGLPQEAGLPFAPEQAIVVMDQQDRPQPKLDRDAGNGMSITVGRIRRCPVLGYRMVVLSHNTVRGAAGAAILNAELLAHQGYL